MNSNSCGQKPLVDGRGRGITYMRLSVTEQCNLSCCYCRPPGHAVCGVEGLLSFDETMKIVRAAARVGITKIRITGGEPLMRDDLPELVRRISGVKGIMDISLTTNGAFLPTVGQALRDAGLGRVNISLDSLRPEVYHAINGGDLEDALNGLRAARELFDEVRLNTVLLRGLNDDELCDFVAFGEKNKVTVRFLELMTTRNVDCNQHFMSNETAYRQLADAYLLQPLEDAQDGVTARWYLVDGGPQVIGFISPVSDSFCASCNRIRVTSRGDIVPCLHGEARIPLWDALGGDNAEDEIIKRLRLAASQKGPGHMLSRGSGPETYCEMMYIGG